MSADGKTEAKHGAHGGHGGDHVKHYTKIYVWLLVLFFIDCSVSI